MSTVYCAVLLSCSCELELPWDPLAESHRDMTLAQRQLWGCPYLAEGKKALLGGTAWREGLERDSSVRKHCELLVNYLAEIIDPFPLRCHGGKSMH